MMLEEAQTYARAAAEEYAATAEATRNRIADEAMAEGDRIISRARSSAAMTRRNILLSAKARALDEAFEAARKEISDTDFGKYRELLIALLSNALVAQAKGERLGREYGDEVASADTWEVLMNGHDRERLGNAVVQGALRATERRIGAECAAKVRLSDECADLDGGLILRCGDVETNCSLTVLLAGVRREIEGKIEHILFEDQTV